MPVVPIEEGISQRLVANTVGVFESETVGVWGIYIGKTPMRPDTTITITQFGGLPPDPKFLLDYPSIQVRVRGDKGKYRDTRLKTKDIKDVLLGCVSQTVNDDRWVSVTMETDPVFLGYDENERPEFVLNFNMIVEPQSTALSNRQAL